jgi:hypothetical protein
MVNALTDPAGAIADDLFPPNNIPGADTNGTTHTAAQRKILNDWDGSSANDIQPGLKGNQTWLPRPDSVPEPPAGG